MLYHADHVIRRVNADVPWLAPARQCHLSAEYHHVGRVAVLGQLGRDPQVREVLPYAVRGGNLKRGFDLVYSATYVTLSHSVIGPQEPNPRPSENKYCEGRQHEQLQADHALHRSVHVSN